MGRKKTLDKLPPEARAALVRWLQDPALTDAERTARVNLLLEELGAPIRVSRSAVNRYAQLMRRQGERMRQAREVAEVWIGKLGAMPQGKIGQLVNEIIRTLAFDLTLTLLEGEIQQPDDVPAVARILKDLAVMMEKLERAASENVKREEEILARERERAKEKLDELERKGLDPETLRRVREEIYGLAEA